MKVRESKLLYFFEGIPTGWEIFLRFITKRDIVRHPPRKQPCNTRATFAEELGSMSKKNNLKTLSWV